MATPFPTKKRVLAQGQSPGQDPLAFLNSVETRLQALSKAIVDLNQSLISIPPTQLSPVAAEQDPQTQMTVLQQQLGEIQKIEAGTVELNSQIDQLQGTVSRLMAETNKTVNMTMNNMDQMTEVSGGPTGPTGMSPTASKKFNLKIAQDLNNIDNIPDESRGFPINADGVDVMEEAPLLKDEKESQTPTVSGLEWRTAADLMRFLNRPRMDREKAEKILMELVPEDKKEGITSLLEEYYEGDLVEEDKLEIAIQIWPMLPDLVRADSPRVEENIMPLSSNTQAFVRKIVKEADAELQRLAKKSLGVKASKSVFNLTKLAQHKSMDNVILYGPDQTYMDEFTRQPASKWSLIERNKGFGLVVDDVWDIDWESIWRGNIMDKYSRPYRNEDGEYVGGYIQKRFEVDKWIPETNNYQLLPGQRRKAYVPEQRSIEARMVAQRSSGDAPYESNDQSKPFNWKEASSKKKS